jgi:cation:H+ antiporter
MVGQVAAGFLLLLAGADLLVRGAAALALRLGLPPLVVGLTVVAFGTSSPELVVSGRASLAGAGAIAVGNVIGSNICNIALILGLASLVRPLTIRAQLIRRDVPVAIAAALFLVLVLLDGKVSGPEGGLLLIGLIVYLGFSLHRARAQAARAPAGGDQAARLEEGLARLPMAPSRPRHPVWLSALFLLAGIGGLTWGADLFVKGSVAAAARLGVSQAVIGLTIVAVGTSLPELATSLMASFRKEGDIAIGNVVGSNIFNTLGILGVAALLRPLSAPGIGSVDLGVMVGLSLLMLPLFRSGFVLTRLEGLLLLLIYAGYLYHLV